ncbi:hypothetical protein LCGC14_0903960 [marine sediment metagenome]|uniref:Uncharacterized protein n=1 Tax=marine sediment metagenome TaxID=412755 RepID=A0A0F9P087_9ZZZZ
MNVGRIIKFLQELMSTRFTGWVKIHFNMGVMSAGVDKMEKEKLR